MKDEFKGTKGEWKCVKRHEVYTDVVDDNGFVIIRVINSIAIIPGWEKAGFEHWSDEGAHRDVSRIEHLSNAKLVAAAPELLEALRQLRDYVEDVCAVSSDDCHDDHPLNLANKAIKKALGKRQ